MSGRVPMLRRKDIFEGVAEIVGMNPGRDKWEDDELLGYRALELKVLEDDEMVEECKKFLYGLHVKMSHRTLAATMILVWNMRSTEQAEKRIFPDVDPGRKDDSDRAIADLEEQGEVYTTDDIDTIIHGVPEFELRRSCAFLAASTLRMFSKDFDSWIKAWDSEHLKNTYCSFTNKEFPLSTLVPKKSEIEYMYEAYQGHKIYLGTLGRILYSLADVGDTRQTDMLFEQHLSCTGMHIVPQFINAKLAMGCSTEDLLSALYMKQNEPTLIQLRDLINNSLSKPYWPENRGTWRYARLFDPNVYAFLQTKYAQDTVAILAHINTMSAVTTNSSNPLSIAVLRQMGAKRLKNARAVAHNIYHYFTVTAKNKSTVMSGRVPMLRRKDIFKGVAEIVGMRW